MVTTKKTQISPPDDGHVQVNIRLTVKQHRALKMLGAKTSRTLAETVGELAIDEADRAGLTSMLSE